MERPAGLARRAPRGCRARQDLRGHLEPMARKGRKEPPGYKVLSGCPVRKGQQGELVPQGHPVQLVHKGLQVLLALQVPQDLRA